MLAMWPLPSKPPAPPKPGGFDTGYLDIPELLVWEEARDGLGDRPRQRYFRLDKESVRVTLTASLDGPKRTDPITPAYQECEPPTILASRLAE